MFGFVPADQQTCLEMKLRALERFTIFPIAEADAP
ncbi:hypothetical protein TRM7557_03902 [Tritonibacter multivorans]|uniref:Uncharacterized protein n=1 Tax=Tritonibacter multivorans TaxID=928856 RepID=A0A0P1GJR0_9RHOB|nr:hypothetical protein TRM7557_03902 [Tritonibacter multivorans]